MDLYKPYVGHHYFYLFVAMTSEAVGDICGAFQNPPEKPPNLEVLEPCRLDNIHLRKCMQELRSRLCHNCILALLHDFPEEGGHACVDLTQSDEEDPEPDGGGGGRSSKPEPDGGGGGRSNRSYGVNITIH
jgi:hypothetical protein